MQSKATLKRHAALVDRMSQAQGLDLEEQMLRGRLTVSDLEDAVLRCTGCSCPDACESWLAEQSGPAQGTPGYCRNQDLFDTLSRG
ncbi:DUF6455 family protein [Pseudoponticoccus marisrubri]|uniref:DUF6455 domain-containing protein n=1 Tax=Pseudoponticoccus marisrubri TaxID=1685382 RepID=A0A0W7WHZ6_9RHOB|nr:DUF6455 family protein [Pseudoponticoccus marisrubri]KUF10213.1 hypothetical protein AVJ23_14320 [Pseudoponticoccus marisrubri]